MTEKPVPYGDFAPRAPEGKIELPSLIAGEGDLELDIGFGRGRSVFARAEVAPESRIIGIEIKAKWSHKVAERAKRLGLTNVLIWAGDARLILDRAGPLGCVRRVSIHFPDPWWKKRHRKRLVVAHAFVERCAHLLAEGGELFVQTDVEDRAKEYWGVIEATPGLSPRWVESNPFEAASNREVRAIEDGLPVHRIVALRGPRTDEPVAGEDQRDDEAEPT